MMGNCNYNELKAFANKIEKMADKSNINKFYEDCLYELAARFLSKVIKLTPVGLTQYEKVTDESGNYVRYKKGKKKGQIKEKVTHTGGTLRKGWKIKEIIKQNKEYKVIINNTVPYASYVNYGHRQMPGRFVKAIGKRLKVGWVDGQFFLEISETELERIMPKFLNKKLDEYIRRCLNDSK